MKIDPILLSVYARTFKSITDEMSISMAQTTRSPILCEANQRMERLKSKVSNLESQLRPLQQVLATPERFALARKQLDDLMAQRKALTAEAQTVDGQLTKITRRLADLEARVVRSIGVDG